jgi:hypothetical protein
MTEIVTDGFVRVPKGTLVFDRYTWAVNKKGTQPAKRDLIVKVRDILGQIDRHVLVALVPEDVAAAVEQTRAYINQTSSGLCIISPSPSGCPALTGHMPDLSKRLKNDFRMVVWGTGDAQRMALIADVEPAAEPVRKDPATHALSKRQQMVKGSVWRFTKDEQIIRQKPNPAWAEARENWYTYSGPIRSFSDYAASLNLSEYLDYVWADVKAGETFTITAKSRTTWRPDEGLVAPIEFRGKASWLPHRIITELAEPATIPVVKQYVLRDTATGLYYADYDIDWQDSARTATPAFIADPMKARRFDDIGRLKQYVLGVVGYYEDLGDDASWGGRPSWAPERKLFDLPSTWEVAVFDKLGRTEIAEAVPDIHAWLKQTMRLRTLTKTFGSSVRKVYADAEKRGDVDQWEAILVARMPKDPQYGIYTDELPAAAVTEMVDLLDQFGCTKAEMRRAKDEFGFAILLKNAKYAFNAKMFYTGDMTLTCIDMATLEEVLPPLDGDSKAA